MTDNEIINIGDVCAYSFDNANKGLSVVEIVNILSDEVVVVKFHQVICDDSGNGYFTYLSDTGKTMNVSKKYLTKIDLINRLKSANEKNERIIELSDKTIKTQSAEIERYLHSIKLLEKDVQTAKSEAIKEFAELYESVIEQLLTSATIEQSYIIYKCLDKFKALSYRECTKSCNEISKESEEMVGDE